MNKFQLNTACVFEVVGEEVFATVPGQVDVIRLSGNYARTVRNLDAMHSQDVNSEVLHELERLGVIEPVKEGLSRRSLVKGGAVLAGAGIATLALPSIAAASSGISVGEIGFWSYNTSGPDGYNIILSAVQGSPGWSEFPFNPTETPPSAISVSAVPSASLSAFSAPVGGTVLSSYFEWVGAEVSTGRVSVDTYRGGGGFLQASFTWGGMTYSASFNGDDSAYL
ncbi:hypothetical protein [Pontimonas salivibrio]|uniref:hypothetical protein n=1 Tax=Pontimonas salivibrio TaxID=1159327 RepID=UPI001319EB71|nr:hypothetical protein [Pontimonas salivibrio]